VLIDDVPTVLAAIQAAQAQADAGAADGGADAGTTDGGATDAGTTDGGPAGAGDYGLSDGGVIEPVSCQGATPDAGPPSLTDPPSCDDIPPPVGKATFRVSVPLNVGPVGSPPLPPDLAANPPIVHMTLNLQHSCPTQDVELQAVDGWASFNALFDGDPDETQAAAKLTDMTFNVEFGDLSDVPVGDYIGDVPQGLRSRVCGAIRFYFERGQPGQPFP
jgi:hypothetical protein